MAIISTALTGNSLQMAEKPKQIPTSIRELSNLIQTACKNGLEIILKTLAFNML